MTGSYVVLVATGRYASPRRHRAPEILPLPPTPEAIADLVAAGLRQSRAVRIWVPARGALRVLEVDSHRRELVLRGGAREDRPERVSWSEAASWGTRP